MPRNACHTPVVPPYRAALAMDPLAGEPQAEDSPFAIVLSGSNKRHCSSEHALEFRPEKSPLTHPLSTLRCSRKGGEISTSPSPTSDGCACSRGRNARPSGILRDG